MTDPADAAAVTADQLFRLTVALETANLIAAYDIGVRPPRLLDVINERIDWTLDQQGRGR